MACVSKLVRLACLLLLCVGAWGEERPTTVTMHGVVVSNGSYLPEIDANKLIGRVEGGHAAKVTEVRNASADQLQYCVVVDGTQKPEMDTQIRTAAGNLIREIARPGDKGRATVFGKSKKNSLIKDWDTDVSALVAFVNTPLEAKGSDPYSALVDCAEHLDNLENKGPAIRAIFLLAGRPTEPSPWPTQWFLQRFARSDIQLYVVSFDAGLLTGGEMKPMVVDEPPPGRRRRREWPPPVPGAVRPLASGWYAPSIYRLAKDSAGDVIQVYPTRPPNFKEFAERRRNQLEFTVAASDRDANTYRDFKLTARGFDVQTATVLYVPKR
jgi:hypothetical protein